MEKAKCLEDVIILNFRVICCLDTLIFPEELRYMLTKAGLTEEQNHIDRRLQVNRGRQLKMHRVWIQCKYRK